MTEGATLLSDATDQLLGELADAVAPFRAVGNALSVLADGLGVMKVVVAVDDARLGRQVFCSDRRPLGEEALGLWGPPGAWTQPPIDLDGDAARLFIRAVGAGVVRATAARVARVEAAEPTPEPASETSRLADVVAGAAARTVRHGWGFTLVLAHGDAGLAAGLREHLRAADTLVTVSDHELALVLPETAGDRVPQVLARLAQAGGMPRFSYGLACCPADDTDPESLGRIAAARLEAARRANAE